MITNLFPFGTTLTSDGRVTTVVSNEFAANYYWLGLAFSKNGNLFGVSRNQIYKIISSGDVEWFSGNEIPAWDGPANFAYFSPYYTRSGAFDSLGDLYVLSSDQSTGRAWVRRVHSDGSVKTLTGNWNQNDAAHYRDGTSSEAQFYGPFGLCVATNGVVYVADTGNHLIRKILPVDWDGDGIPDAAEGGDTPYAVGVDDRLVDSDGDGMSNAAEFIAGTDPKDPKSRLFVEVGGFQTDGSILLSWPSVGGKVYDIQFSSDLTTWNIVTNGIQGTGQLLTFTTLGSTNQFFRVGVQSK